MMNLDLYHQDCLRRGLSGISLPCKLRVLRTFQAFVGKPMEEASTADIERWLGTRQLTSASRAAYLSTLHCFYVWCNRTGRTDRDPTAAIPRPRTPRRLPRPIGDVSLRRAMATAAPVMGAWLALGAFGGLRCVEMAQLRREHVWDARTPPLLLVQGKGDKDRLLPLHPEVARRLAMLEPQGSYVFTCRGRPYLPGTISSYIARYLHGLGINDTAHQLRHWFGTHVYAASGHDLRMTQELLGHADPKTTAIYAAWDPTRAYEVVAGLGNQDGQCPQDQPNGQQHVVGDGVYANQYQHAAHNGAENKQQSGRHAAPLFGTP